MLVTTIDTISGKKFMFASHFVTILILSEMVFQFWKWKAIYENLLKHLPKYFFHTKTKVLQVVLRSRWIQEPVSQILQQKLAYSPLVCLSLIHIFYCSVTLGHKRILKVLKKILPSTSIWITMYLLLSLIWVFILYLLRHAFKTKRHSICVFQEH